MALPPGPYHYVTTSREGEHQGAGYVYLVDVNNRKIASIWGTVNEKLALVELIVRVEHEVRVALMAKRAAQETG